MPTVEGKPQGKPIKKVAAHLPLAAPPSCPGDASTPDTLPHTCDAPLGKYVTPRSSRPALASPSALDEDETKRSGGHSCSGYGSTPSRQGEGAGVAYLVVRAS